MTHIYDPLKHYSFSRKVSRSRLNILKSRSVNIKKSLKSKKLDHQNWHERNAKCYFKLKKLTSALKMLKTKWLKCGNEIKSKAICS